VDVGWKVSINNRALKTHRPYTIMFSAIALESVFVVTSIRQGGSAGRVLGDNMHQKALATEKLHR
jgi:hypothetical protein